MKRTLFFGMDLGTQGVRGVISDEKGHVAAAYSKAFSSLNCSSYEEGYEQRPSDWRETVLEVMKACREQLEAAGIKAEQVAAMSIDGTSGTVLPVDGAGEALMPALMYNDMRAGEEAALIRETGAVLERKMGFRFNASFSLPKILWIRKHLPQIHERARYYVHQADYIVGQLCGICNKTDYSNALKTGYDLLENRWPSFLTELGIKTEMLPEVVAPGTEIGRLLPRIACETGFSEKLMVVAGATDGYASALAAGAVRPGDWASVIGTTLVLKGVTRELLVDKNGNSYSHKLPSGAWMLGGAANLGGRCLNDAFPRERFGELNQWVPRVIPTGVISYPLHGKGERFLFLNPDAEAFFQGDISDERVFYAALMEGVAYGERFAFEYLQKAGAEVGPVICTAGGVCRSKEWLRIRASVLNRELRVPKIVDAAMGCTLLAASASCYASLEEAASHMISFQTIVQPDPRLAGKYEYLYQKARAEYLRRFCGGYL